VTAERALEVARLELPDLYCAVLGARRQGGILRVKGKSRDVCFVSF
jgi:hypothetical protein